VGHPHLTRNPKIDQGIALTLAADPPKKLLGDASRAHGPERKGLRRNKLPELISLQAVMSSQIDDSDFRI